jgi:Fe2+ or Zn2+ uptake regulation protein
MSQDYHLKCPKCGHEFDLNYDPLNSLSDPEAGIIIREGTYRFAAKCPECKKRSHYHMSEDEKQLSNW